MSRASCMETQLAIEAEAMGFDYVGPVEHHFTDYAACPDPFQLLAYVAAKTSTINLITAAVILPWNNPLRVVEQALELDILSEGRLILGMGRGAARREFRSFGVELADSREMFDEAALIVMEGIETGIVEADTKWYRIPRTEVRPRPFKSFKDRTVMVSMSPSSVEVAANYGLRTLRFSQGDWRNAIPEINHYRETFQKLHGKTAPPFIISDFVLCFNDKQRVTKYCDGYFSKMFATVANHYEFMSDHFKELPSYSTYANMGQAAAAAGGPRQGLPGLRRRQHDWHSRGAGGAPSHPQGDGRRLRNAREFQLRGPALRARLRTAQALRRQGHAGSEGISRPRIPQHR